MASTCFYNSYCVSGQGISCHTLARICVVKCSLSPSVSSSPFRTACHSSLFSWSATADHYSLLKRLWRTQRIFSAAGQFLYMKAQACVTGRADGKPELRGKALLSVYVQWKFPKGQPRICQSLIGSVWFVFPFGPVPCIWMLPFLILAWSQRIIKQAQWVEVLRKPPEQADVYLPSWPLGTHCACAWLVVMDPFNSVPERKR